MFELLATDDLQELHDALVADATAIHYQMMTPGGMNRIPVFGDQWTYLSDIHDLIHATMLAADAEINRRLELPPFPKDPVSRRLAQILSGDDHDA